VYGFENLFLTLREECRFGVFENRLVRGMFGYEGGGRNKWLENLHNKERADLYSSSNIIRKDEMGGYVARKGEAICTHKNLFSERWR
jgi:hypothetical protein